MAIRYEIKTENGLLSVKVTGKDDNLEQVLNYGMAIIEAALSNSCSKVLCDETELVYTLGTFDTFQAANFISEHAPDVAKVAIVCSPENIIDADFWETVAVNRGLHVRVFKTTSDAEHWLMKE